MQSKPAPRARRGKERRAPPTAPVVPRRAAVQLPVAGIPDQQKNTTADGRPVADKAGAECNPAGHTPAARPPRAFRRRCSATSLVRMAALAAQPVLLD